VLIDADLVMRSHVTHVVAECFAVLRHLRLISLMLSPSMLKMMVVALVLSRLDYTNSVLTGLPTYLVKCLQSALNALAFLIYGVRRFAPFSEALMSLHWLCIPERIQLKLAVLVHRVLYGNAPDYLGPFTRLSDVPSRSSLRSGSSHHLLIKPVRHSTVGARVSSLEKFTGWHYVYRHSSVCQSFVVVSEIICSFTRIQKPFPNCITFYIVA